MQNDTAIIVAIIGSLMPLVLAVLAAIWWFGKLSTRVNHLEDDVEELKTEQKRILELLNRHLGQHEGRDAA